MMADVIVGASVALLLAFVGAWAISPRLRRWIERPKYRFQETLSQYDRDGHRRSRAHHE